MTEEEADIEETETWKRNRDQEKNTRAREQGNNDTDKIETGREED